MEVIPTLVPVSDRSAIGEVRRRAVALATAAELGEEAAGRAAIVATELASNIVKHGTSGHCFLSLAEDAGELLVQIVAVDTGRGIDDPGRALRDGYSTAGTLGTGLGAVRRLSRSFDIFSQAGGGAVVVARVGVAASMRSPAPTRVVEVSAVEAPLLGEPVSGDAWTLEREGATSTLFVADGLGHGLLAAESAQAAVSAFHSHAGSAPAERVERIHHSLRGRRGAAIAVAEIDPHRHLVRYAGIGNIAAQILAGGALHRLASMNGTAGQVARTIREFSYEFPPSALLIVHSDGMSARWTLERYPGLGRRDPAVIAAVLHRDYRRGRDDVTVVVARSAETLPDAGRQVIP
jgi:anti-sigma regulatory factor (Ser/Thr protein kinase)